MLVAAALAALALAAPPVTRDVLPVYVAPSHAGQASGVDYEYAWGPQLGALPHLGVFDRPRGPRDRLPRLALTFGRFSHGDVAASRRLLAAGRTSIYAWPAKGGTQLCIERLPRGGGTCVSSFVHGAYPQVQPRDAVRGVVDDGAVRVDVHGRAARAARDARPQRLLSRVAASSGRAVADRRPGAGRRPARLRRETTEARVNAGLSR